MNTVTKRAYVLLAIILAFIAGVAILGAEFFLEGETWATSRVNGHLYSGNEVKIACDSVISSAGYISNPLTKAGGNVHLVGDCLQIGNLRTVIWRAYEVAMKI